jgi:tetratricopeptide (TPR) repeat protein
MWQLPDEKQFLEIALPVIGQGDADRVARIVRVHWSPRDLSSLLTSENVEVRRVAAICLGLVGTLVDSVRLVRALRDPDSQVNQMAEHGLWSIWMRSGEGKASSAFKRGMEMMGAESYAEAARLLHEAVEHDPNFAEAYNQCGIAHYFLCQWEECLSDLRQAVRLVPHHYDAIASMGHCFAEVGDWKSALRCYRRALAINPNMPTVRSAVERLKANELNAGDSSGFLSTGAITS